METSVNLEESLEKQLHELVNKLVMQRLNESLKKLLLPSSLPEEQPNTNQFVKTQTEAKPVYNQFVETQTEAQQRQEATPKTEPLQLCEHKIKRMVRELTPDLKRKELPLLIQVRMLVKLYEHREYGIAPTELFSYAGTGKIAGYRYISFFKERSFLAFTGAKKDGKYILTSKGIALLERQ